MYNDLPQSTFSRECPNSVEIIALDVYCLINLWWCQGMNLGHGQRKKKLEKKNHLLLHIIIFRLNISLKHGGQPWMLYQLEAMTQANVVIKLC